MTVIEKDTARTMVDSFRDSSRDEKVHIVTGKNDKVEFVETDGKEIGIVNRTSDSQAYEFSREEAVNKFNMFVNEFLKDPEVESKHKNYEKLGLYT